MAENEYKVSLGAEIDEQGLANIKKQINSLEKTDPIKVKIDEDYIESQIKNIKKQIEDLGNTKSKKKNALSIDTTSLENSLKDVDATIKDIKSSIGTLDSGKGMKSLLSSINQISTALEKASNQFDELNGQLKTLGSKDFSINLGVNMGGSNPIARQTAYGNKARNDTLPQLKQQMNALVKYYNDTYKESADEFVALQKLVSGTKLSSGDFFQSFLFGKDSVASRMSGGSLSSQMQAYKQYIDMFKQAASLKGLDISGVTSGFSKSADDLIKDAQDIQTGANEMQDGFEKLKQVFGGSGIDSERLSVQLDSIVADLNEIKTTIQGLSSGITLDGLTQGFDRLSDTLEKLMSNVTLVQNGLNTGFSGAGSSLSSTGSGISKVAEEFKEVDIVVKNSEEQIESLETVLHSIGFNNGSIDTITKDFEELGISVKNVTSRLNDDGSVTLTVKGLDQFERAVTVMKSVTKDAETGEFQINNLGTTISQDFKETENAFKRLKSLAKEMGSLEFKIAGLDADKNKSEITELTAQLDRVKNEYNELYAITNRNLSSSQIDNLSQEFVDAANKVESLKSKMADTSAVEKQNRAFKELMTTAKEIGSLEFNIAKLKSQGGNDNLISELENELRTLQTTYKQLVETMDTPLSNDQWSSIYTEIAQTEDKITQLSAKIADAKEKLAHNIKLKLDDGTFDNDISNINSRFEKLSNQSDETRNAIKLLNQELDNINIASQKGDIEGLISANERYEQALKSVKNQLDINARAEKDAIDVSKLEQNRTNLSLKMDNWLKDNSAAAKQFGSRIKELQVELRSCDNVRLDGIKREFTEIQRSAQLAGKNTQTLGDRLKAQFSKYSAYLGVAELIMWTEQGLRDMFEQVKLIDSAMTELKKVTDETDASYDKFLTNAASRAKEIGTTIDGLVESTADFARLGYGFQDAQGLAEVANIYAVVGDEVEGVEGATESLISTMAAFKDEMNGMSNADFAMSIIDNFNEVGNKFAISSGGLGEAFKRSASSMAAANNTIAETTALITAANTVVQNPEKIGNGFKTIAMRIRGAKTELEEAGESTDGMAESTASLRAEIKALSGVDIMLDSNTFKSTYQIMDELSQKWEGLSDIAQASITELLAGKHQGNVMSSLMANFDTARDVLETSLNSSGSAMKEHEKWSQSLEARLLKLKAAWQGFAQSFMNSDLLKGGISFFAGLLDILDKLVSNLGLLGTIGLGAVGKGIFGYFKGAKEAKKTLNDVVDAIQGLNGAASETVESVANITSATTEATESVANMASAVTESQEALANTASTTTETKESMANLSSTVTENAESVANMNSAATENVEAMSNMNSIATETQETVANLTSAITENAESSANMASAVTENAEAVSNLSSAATEGVETVSNLSSAASDGVETAGNLANAASEGVEAVTNLGSAATSTGNAFKTFVKSGMGKVAIIGAIIAVIGLAINQYKKYREELSKTRQEDIKSSDEFLDSALKLEQAYIKYSGKTNLTSEEESELESAINGTVNALNDKSSALQKAVNSGNDYVANLEKITKAELEEAKKAADKKKIAAEKELEDTASNWATWTGSKTNFTLPLSAGKESKESKETINIASDILEDYYSETKTKVGKGKATKHSVGISSDANASEIVDYYNALVKYQEALVDAELEDTDAYDRVSVVLNDMSKSIDTYVNGVYDAVKAQYQLKNGIPKTTEEYLKMRESILNNSEIKGGSFETKKTIAGTLDSEYGVMFDLSSVEAQAKKLIGVINQYNDDNVNQMETFLNLRTKVNNNECTVGDYISQFGNIKKMTKDWTKEEKEEFNLTFGIDTDTVKTQYDAMFKTLSRDMDENIADKFLNGLTAGELSAAFSMKAELDWKNSSLTKDDVEKELNKLGDGGNVNLSLRPEIDTSELKKAGWDEVAGDIATVFTSTFSNKSEDIAMNFTPIMADKNGKYLGTLSPDELQKYAEEVIAGTREDDLNLKIGATFKGEDAIEQAELAAKKIHELQDIYYNDKDIMSQIQKEADLIEALNFNANIEIDTTALEMLNTALAESASAMGLTSESIDSLKSRYSSLDSYDPSTLFEKTANGVKVNREELAKLEKEYNDLTNTEVEKHLETLAGEYNKVTAEIDKCSNAAERAELLAKREQYADQIEELARYQTQLEGVTGAYQRWIDAQSAPEDYEGYEGIAQGKEDVKDEIKRGFIGNATKEYIDLLSGKDLQGGNIDDYANAWEKLDDKVTGAGHSIMDFFTVNDDGDITSTGIDRFFKSIQTDFKGSVAKFDKESGKWMYDFSQENLEKIQDKWGMGIEAIGIMLEAAAAAGYNVDWGGILDDLDLDTSNFETLVEYAESAQRAFNKLDLDGIEDVEFNFKTTNVEDATSELEKADKAYKDLITNKDGTINLNAKGADQMRIMLSTLLVQKQQLEDSNIVINVDTSKIDKSQQDVADAISAVQTFREKYKNLEIAVTTGQGIDEAKKELSGALTELQGLGDEGVDIAAQLIFGEGTDGSTLSSKVDAAVKAVGKKDIKVGCKLDETAIGDLNSQILTNFTPEATIKITEIDESLVGEYTATEKTANGKVKWDNDTALIVEYQNKVHEASGKVNWSNNTEKVKKNFSANGTVKWTSGNKVKVNVISEAKGTANANGTAGRAFARGNWGIKGGGTALGGELGQELVVRDGRFFTIGDNGAEFFKYKNNDIVFNAAQTESLFKYGGIKGAKPRGTMLASGTAFAEGKAFPWNATASSSNFADKRVQTTTVNADKVVVNSKDDKSSSSNSSGSKKSSSSKNSSSSSKNSSSSSSSSTKDTEKFEETIDWIEIAISRIERAIDNLDQKASNVYKKWSTRNNALVKEIGEVYDEINLQQRAYNEYMKAAKGVGLSSSWAKKVREGKVDIETIKDEVLKEKISDYQNWYLIMPTYLVINM